MHWTLALMILAVIWAASNNHIPSLALVFAWCVGQAAWMITGDYIPAQTYMMADALVLAVIFKYGHRTSDLLIAGIFMFQWALYPYGDDAWWPLYWLALLQMVLAGPVPDWPQFRRLAYEGS